MKQLALCLALVLPAISLASPDDDAVAVQIAIAKAQAAANSEAARTGADRGPVSHTAPGCGAGLTVPSYTPRTAETERKQSAAANPKLRQEGPAAVLLESDLGPDAQPTPIPAIKLGLDALQLTPHDVFVEFGCGFDARWSINAVRVRGVKRAIGIEIDPKLAESARAYVAQSGFADRITIITGDATTVDLDGATVGCAYLWEETLAQLRPKIQQLGRFVSYAHPIPGLPTRAISANGQTVYLWTKPVPVTRVPITRSVRQTVRLPRGSYCSVCGRHCSNPMAHKLQQQIVGYQTVPTNKLPPPPPEKSTGAGHWETRRVCRNGVCTQTRVWVPQ